MTEIAEKDDEQKDAEAEVEEFKDDLGPFVIAAETTRMAMVFTDAKVDGHPIIFANNSFLKLTGYPRNEILAKSFSFLLAQDMQGGDLDAIEAEFAGPGADPEFHYRRKDGSEFWASIFVNPVKDEDGTIVQHFISLVDTTKYRNVQDNAAMLIDELNHRVKNTLATVQSIVTQAVRNASDPQIVRESIETRRRAVAFARPARARQLGRRRPPRSCRAGARTVQRHRRPHRALHDRGRECPAFTQSDAGAWNRVPRTGHQRGQIRRVLERGGDDLDRMGTPNQARGPLAVSHLA